MKYMTLRAWRSIVLFSDGFWTSYRYQSLNITPTRILKLRFDKFLPLRSYFQTLNNYNRVSSDKCRECFLLIGIISLQQVIKMLLNLLWKETLVQPECRGGFQKGLLRDVMGISGFSLRSHFFAPHRDTYVTTKARMTCVKNTLRIFRGYFNRKRVRRKNVWSVHVSNFAKCFLFIRYQYLMYTIL